MFPVNLISRFKSFPAYADMRLVEDNFESRLNNYFASDNCWLDEREQQIILKFFKEEKTLQKIGEELFITRERVRQIIASSVKKLDYLNSRFNYFFDDEEDVKYVFSEKELKLKQLTNEIQRIEEMLVVMRTKYYDDSTTLGEIKQILQDTEEYRNAKTIDELDLTVRTYNCLSRSGIKYVSQITQMTENDLMKLRNFGKKCLKEIKAILKNSDLSLKEE